LVSEVEVLGNKIHALIKVPPLFYGDASELVVN
jgi:hypothetical protein